MSTGPRQKSRLDPERLRGWRRCRIWFRRFRITIWLLILALVWSLVYVNQIGLPSFVKKPLLEKLRARGVDLQFSRLRLRWDEGIVAENVRFGRADEPLGPHLTLAEVQVQLNHQALRRFRLQVDSLLLRRGRLVWPLARSNGPLRQLFAEDINSELRFLPGDQWALDEFTAGFAGAKIKLWGAITNASAVREWKWFQTKEPSPAGVWQDRLRQLADTLERIHFSAPPELKLNVSGDARELQSFQAHLLLNTPGADMPWGQVAGGRFAVRVFPARSNELSHAELSLEASEAKTRWAAATNLQLSALLAREVAQPDLVNGSLTLLSGPAETEWGRTTNATLTAQWVHALTNPVPLTGQGQLRLQAPETQWGRAKEIQLTAHLVSSDTPRASPLTHLGYLLPDWWTNLGPYLLDWECQLRDLVSPKLEAERITGGGSWRAPELTITNLQARLYQAQLEASASINVATRWFSAQLASDVDPHKISPLLTEGARNWLEQYSWEKPPQLQAEAALTLPAWTNRQPNWRAEVQPTLRLQGQFRFDQGGAFRGVPVATASSSFSYSNRWWRLPDLVATRPEGQLSANYAENERTRDYSWHVTSTIDPLAVRPLLETNQQRALDFFTFRQLPAIEADVRGRRIWVKGRVALTNFTFRGEAADRFQTELEYTNGLLLLADAHAQLGTQQLHAASLLADFAGRKIYLTNGFSTADPQIVARAIGPKVGRVLEPYRFRQPPTAHVEGIIPIGSETEADLRFEVAGGPFEWWRFSVPYLAGNVHWAGDRLTLSDVRARFYEGQASGWARFNFGPSRPGQDDRGADYQFAATVTNTDLRLLMAGLVARTNNLEGSLSGNLVVTKANSSDWRDLAGYGNVELRNGLIWDIPIFGIFSDVLNSLSPGLGNSRASAGTGSFTITNGLIQSDDVEIRAPALRLQYRGGVDVQGQVNARVEAELLRDVWVVGPLVSAALWPVTKAFEYKVSGSLNQPKAEPVYLIPKIVLMPFHPFQSLKGLFPEEPGGGPTNAPPLATPPNR
ncbi:MAG: hypothetical protein DME25_06590 [Verrucomicrobia bacterium]|nr:MAG: hypothetical protein DME25_06590 [Verrucomicrobiota bacterium]